MSDTMASVAAALSGRGEKNRLPRRGICRLLVSQSREDNFIVVRLYNGEERRISRNVSNFGIKLAKGIKSGTI